MGDLKWLESRTPTLLGIDGGDFVNEDRYLETVQVGPPRQSR